MREQYLRDEKPLSDSREFKRIECTKGDTNV